MTQPATPAPDFTEAEVKAAQNRENQIAEAARIQALSNRLLMLSIENERLTKRVAELEADD